MYPHRRTKRVSDDDIMVCACDPRDGCGADCINRQLQIECTPGYCPCGDGCRNMAFQRRSYAPLRNVAVGRKGFGLVCDRALAKGDFVIEYTGEVLDQKSFAARKERYGEEGQRHYYFMTLSNTETIDAHRKGNLGRFLNHSCEPNCRPEKWQVRGELCIGIFASRDIPAGEELTFDYQMERFDKAQPCFCGAPSCGGVMGGTNIDHAEAKELLEQIAADDPEEGFDEPEYRFVDPVDAGDGVDPDAAPLPPRGAAGGRPPRRKHRSERSLVAERKLVGRLKASRNIVDALSMVEQELQPITTKSLKLRRPECAVEYLRLFKEATSGNAGQAAGGGPPGAALAAASPSAAAAATSYSSRDLSILLEVMIKTDSYAAQTAMLKAGAPGLLLGVCLKLAGDRQQQACVRKALRGLLALPLTKAHMGAVRMGMVTLVDAVRRMASERKPLDAEVRKYADELAYKFFPRPVAPRPAPAPVAQQQGGQPGQQPGQVGAPQAHEQGQNGHQQQQQQQQQQWGGAGAADAPLTGHKRPREDAAEAADSAAAAAAAAEPARPPGSFADPFSEDFRFAVRTLVKERLHIFMKDPGRAHVSRREYEKVKEKFSSSFIEREKQRHAKERTHGEASLITKERLQRRVKEFVERCVYKMKGIREQPRAPAPVRPATNLEWD